MANIYDINTFPTSEAEYKKHEIVKITASSDPIVYPAMADQVKPAPQNNTYYYEDFPRRGLNKQLCFKCK